MRFRIPLAVFVLCGAALDSTSDVLAQDALHCEVPPEAPPPHSINKRGYIFSVSSLLGTPIEESGRCLQKLIRNGPESTAFNFDWSYALTPTATVNNSGIVSGCYDDTEVCDCENVPCQIGIEYISDLLQAQKLKTLLAFGWHADQYHRQIPALVETGFGSSMPAGEGAGIAGDEPYTPTYRIQAVASSEPLVIETVVTGAPATLDGRNVPLEFRLVSRAVQSENGFQITQRIEQLYDYADEREFLVASISAISGRNLNPDLVKEDTVVVAWDGYEPPDSTGLFHKDPSMLYEIADIGEQQLEAKEVAVSMNARALVYFRGHIVLNVATPIFVPAP